MLATALGASASYVYVVNGAGDAVDVIDTKSDKVVRHILNMEGAFGTAFSPDAQRVYISDEYKDVIFVVNRSTGSIIKTISVSGHPSMLAATGDGKRIFVNLQSKPPLAGIEVIDANSLRKLHTIPMRGPMHDLCLSADGKYLVSASDIGNFLVVIDVASEVPLWELSFDQRVYTMAIESHPDGSPNRIFVQLRGLNGFNVVDFEKRTITRSVALPDERKGYLAGFGNPSHGIAVAPDQSALWVNSGESNCVFIYSLPELVLIGRVPLPERELPGGRVLGAQPNWITFTPEGGKVYVSDTWLNAVSAIDVKNMAVISTIPVGELPRIIDTLTLP